MTFNLVEGIDVAAIEAKIANYQEENAEQIINARARHVCLIVMNVLRFMQAEELAAALKAGKGNPMLAETTDGAAGAELAGRWRAGTVCTGCSWRCVYSTTAYRSLLPMSSMYPFLTFPLNHCFKIWHVPNHSYLMAGHAYFLGVLFGSVGGVDMRYMDREICVSRTLDLETFWRLFSLSSGIPSSTSDFIYGS
ncbi:hypothetical protein AAC387_Pa04g0922 [Persea americana]